MNLFRKIDWSSRGKVSTIFLRPVIRMNQDALKLNGPLSTLMSSLEFRTVPIVLGAPNLMSLVVIKKAAPTQPHSRAERPIDRSSAPGSSGMFRTLTSRAARPDSAKRLTIERPHLKNQFSAARPWVVAEGPVLSHGHALRMAGQLSPMSYYLGQGHFESPIGPSRTRVAHAANAMGRSSCDAP
jgi:hypothetical protein